MKNKINNTMSYESQENLILGQTDAFIGLLTKRGILGDHQIDDEKIRIAQQEKRRNSYHNTLMLMQHYRTIVWVMESFPEGIAKELEEPLEDLDVLLDHVDAEMAMGNKKLESRIESARKSRLLLERVNEALTILKNKPDDGERLYELIYLTYISPERINHHEILTRLNLSSRHYYRLRQQAITILSIRLWATPTKDMDFWFEMLTLLEGLE
jgi:hypothetical protein